MSEITKGTRLINYLIDITVITLITKLIADLYYIYDTIVVYFLIYFSYYFVLEAISGQTLGKTITGTIIVNMYNQKPKLWKTFLRSLLRLYPFDSVSFLFGQEQGAHDLLSKTRLVNKKARKKINSTLCSFQLNKS